MAKKSFGERVWEVLPGLSSWIIIIGLLILTFVNPVIAATFILVYTIYWLIKIVITAAYMLAGFVRHKREMKVNWWNKLKTDFKDDYRRLYHLIIIPTYKEDISILRHTLQSIDNSNYDSDRMIVVVAFEDRDKELAPKYGPMVIHEFEHRFHKILTTYHPSDIEGEVKGKGPNMTWAAHETMKYINKENLPYEDVIVTSMDADNRVDPQYFANVAWNYLSVPDPTHKSFQPLPMFFNNIHQVPMAIKIVALGSTFWQLTQAMRPYFLRNFAAHSQSLAALVETDFWSVTTIVEDGHQFWRSYFKFDGNHEVIPIFIPVYMDAVQGDDLGDTLKAQYLQRRRWFWGVSDVPFVFAHSWGNKKIPFIHKWMEFIRLLDSHVSLSTQSFILLIGWLPITLHPTFRNTVIGYNFPLVYQYILAFAWVGTIATMTISTLIVPPRPGRQHWDIWELGKYWVLTPILMPFTSVFFGALPSLDSQTRMMFNKPFTVFNVTKKAAIPSGVVRVDS